MNLRILFVNSLKQSWKKLVQWELAFLLALVLLKLTVHLLPLEEKENVKLVKERKDEEEEQRSVNLKEGGGVKLEEKENKFNIIKLC